MVYFLGLLGVALCVASLLVYRNAEQTLKAKRQATADLIERSTTNAAAPRTLRLIKPCCRRRNRWRGWYKCNSSRSRDHHPAVALCWECCLPGFNANGYAMVPTWLAEGVPPPRRPRDAQSVWLEVRAHVLSGVKLKEDCVLPARTRLAIIIKSTIYRENPTIRLHDGPPRFSPR